MSTCWSPLWSPRTRYSLPLLRHISKLFQIDEDRIGLLQDKSMSIYNCKTGAWSYRVISLGDYPDLSIVNAVFSEQIDSFMFMSNSRFCIIDLNPEPGEDDEKIFDEDVYAKCLTCVKPGVKGKDSYYYLDTHGLREISISEDYLSFDKILCNANIVERRFSPDLKDFMLYATKSEIFCFKTEIGFKVSIFNIKTREWRDRIIDLSFMLQPMVTIQYNEYVIIFGRVWEGETDKIYVVNLKNKTFHECKSTLPVKRGRYRACVLKKGRELHDGITDTYVRETCTLYGFNYQIFPMYLVKLMAKYYRTDIVHLVDFLTRKHWVIQIRYIVDIDFRGDCVLCAKSKCNCVWSL